MGCGKELDRAEASGEYCHDCIRRPRSFAGGIALLNYNEGAKKVIYGLKYQNKRDAARFLAEETIRRHGRRLLRIGADALVPVPLHKSRRRERGYNQAALLARELGRCTGIPVEEKLLLRVRKTAPLKTMSKAERTANLRGAFAVSGRIPGGSRILLVDDIYTTGSTADAAAACLKGHGCSRVFLLTVAAGG